ncbi:proteasome ATPase [Bifidobacterium jacchi]|uniref:AAA ATPase forming ring-shaped complexes n=1 Tax=Bifidobacterium jacchi TaxID=2490545 RepID=A0A5N5RJS6_9BIFI|nr:proteasome ATPase [Bifidobacterium jacchi]KAB5607555.1 proteasome ATPase [Bifidobacterium jacchi]
MNTTMAEERSARELAELNDRLMEKNHALAAALTRAGKELTKAKSQLSQLAQPPLTFATMVRVDEARTDEDGIQHASAEVLAGTRRMIVPVAANVNAARLTAGNTVTLNENMVLVAQRGPDTLGAVRTVRQTLADGRIIVADASGNPRLVRRAGALANASINPSDRVIVDAAERLALEVLPQESDADLVLEETPDVTFDDIGGLDEQIGRIRDAVELPFLHRDLYRRYDLNPPKGVLLYGPPGNGKTLIAKAVAHALAAGPIGDGGRSGSGTSAIGGANAAGVGPAAAAGGVFLSVKGPELLNKFVGESERLVRQIFKRARERAEDGRPVIVFIDEMDSLLRTRGSGVSSDVETTIVPQFLAELDGVERLDNVMVIGASNRIDMIDPAVLRPGRLDVKIHIDRPGERQGAAIVRHYLTDDLPFDPATDSDELAAALVRDAYARAERRHLCDACDEHGVWSPVYLADVASGAMLKNIVDRAKTKAVKQSIESGSPVALGPVLVGEAVDDEFAETRDAVLDADPVQWSRINGMDAGRITRIRSVR